MTIEDESIYQANSARRERLRALRAAKEYISMPYVNGDGNYNNGPKAEFMADVHEENYEMLAEFFNCLDSSIRLLRLKGVSSTFTNISASIQHLTERRFTYKHLAQMKHILPEAISIKKVLLRDETTCCMKPELQVSLQVDAVENSLELRGESAYTDLRKVFRSRLVQFAMEHPEEDDIPEETLPHLYGHTKQSR